MNIFPEILEIEKNKRQVASDAAGFKGTSAFKQFIDNKINDLAEASARKIRDFNFKYEGKTEKIGATTIRKWFLKDFNHFSLEERKKQIREKIKITLENYLDSSLSDKTSERIFTPQEVEKMLAQYFKDWPDFKKIYNDEVISWYIEILKNTGQLGEALDNAQTKISQNVSDWDKYFSCFTLNDWAVFFYMYQRIVGENKNKYKFIAIDEAQMLSPLWLAGLNYLLEEGGKINLTGDLNQKPPVIDLYDWNELEEIIGPIETRELTKCYRLTDEVAKYALDVLFKHPPYHVETVGRIGEEILKLEGGE